MTDRIKFFFYIEILIEGERINTFLNICRKNGIVFKHTVLCDDNKHSIKTRVSRKDFLKLRKYIRMSKVHIKIIRKAYPRYYIFRYRTHYSFFIGVAIMFFMLKFFGLFVWEVDFSGNYMYTDEALKRYMQDKGVKNGEFIKNIDCDSLEENIRNDFDVTWASIEVKGSRVVVYIKENYSHNDNETKEYSNGIYSQCDGTIDSIITRRGTPLVIKGDSVSKGQQLVQGEVSITDDSGTQIDTVETKADADIYIKTVLPYFDELDSTEEEVLYTGKKRYRLAVESDNWLVKAGIGFNAKRQYETYLIKKPLYIAGVFDTNIYMGIEVQKECVINNKSLTKEEAEKKLNERLLLYIKHIEKKGVQIIECRVNIDTSRNYCCEGEIEVLVTPETDMDS